MSHTWSGRNSQKTSTSKSCFLREDLKSLAARVCLNMLRTLNYPKTKTKLKLMPRPHVSFLFLKTDIFVSGLVYRPHVSGQNGHRKRIFSKTLCRVKSFKSAGFSFACGRTETEVFEYDDVILYVLIVWRKLNKGCYRISIVLAVCVIFAYKFSRRDGENNGFLASVPLLPSRP